jgi:hypothetical protein
MKSKLINHRGLHITILTLRLKNNYDWCDQENSENNGQNIYDGEIQQRTGTVKWIF